MPRPIRVKFSASRIKDGAIEVEMFNVKYQYEFGRDVAAMQIVKKGDVVEASRMLRESSKISISLMNISEGGASWTMYEEDGGVNSEIIINHESINVKSDRQSHAIELTQALRGKDGLSMPLLRRFSAQYTQNEEFRQELTALGARMPNGGLGAACGIACAACLIVPKTVICCEVCAACMLLPG